MQEMNKNATLIQGDKYIISKKIYNETQYVVFTECEYFRDAIRFNIEADIELQEGRVRKGSQINPSVLFDVDSIKFYYEHITKEKNPEYFL